MTLTPSQKKEFTAYKKQMLQTLTWENLLARMLDFDKDDEDLILGYLQNGFGGRAGKELIKALRRAIVVHATATFKPSE